MAKKITPPDRIVNKFIVDYILRNVWCLNIMPSMLDYNHYTNEPNVLLRKYIMP